MSKPCGWRSKWVCGRLPCPPKRTISSQVDTPISTHDDFQPKLSALAIRPGVLTVTPTPTAAQEVLLVREYAAGVNRYEWTLPSGGIDPDESLYGAAARELKEAGYCARAFQTICRLALATLATRGAVARPPLRMIPCRSSCCMPRALPHSHSNIPTIPWYFSMYQRFSLLYLGIDTARTSVPCAFQRHGQVTGAPATCAPRSEERRVGKECQ